MLGVFSERRVCDMMTHAIHFVQTIFDQDLGGAWHRPSWCQSVCGRCHILSTHQYVRMLWKCFIHSKRTIRVEACSA